LTSNVKIKSINIKNFMTINKAHLDFTKGVKTRENSTNNGTNVVPFTVIVGPNGSGKTNVIRAVQIFSKLFLQEDRRLISRPITSASGKTDRSGSRYRSSLAKKKRGLWQIRWFWVN